MTAFIFDAREHHETHAQPLKHFTGKKVRCGSERAVSDNAGPGLKYEKLAHEHRHACLLMLTQLIGAMAPTIQNAGNAMIRIGPGLRPALAPWCDLIRCVQFQNTTREMRGRQKTYLQRWLRCSELSDPDGGSVASGLQRHSCARS